MDTCVNLAHLKLLHHFQTCTSETLPYPQQFWDYTLQLSLHFDFLANMMFCVSARHLATLNPDDTIYTATACSHLSRGLSRFNEEISNVMATHLDAFIATTALLQFELWASTDSIVPERKIASSSKLAVNRMFATSGSLKLLFIKTVTELATKHQSALLPYLAYDPRECLVASSALSSCTVAEYQTLFSRQQPLTAQSLTLPILATNGAKADVKQLGQETHCSFDTIEREHTMVVNQMSVLLSLLTESGPLQSVTDNPSLLSDIARLVFSFPLLCYRRFGKLVANNDPHALLVLYHFYRATRILLFDSRYWWALNQATAVELSLREWFTTKMGSCSAMG